MSPSPVAGESRTPGGPQPSLGAWGCALSAWAVRQGLLESQEVLILQNATLSKRGGKISHIPGPFPRLAKADPDVGPGTCILTLAPRPSSGTLPMFLAAE